MREILLRAAGDITRLGEGLAIGVQQHDRRESFDAELVRQRLVLGLLLSGLFLLLRVVELHEDEVLGDRGEFLLVEDFLLQADAPAAPVAAGEVDQDRLLLGLGDLHAFIEVGQPDGVSGGKGKSAQAKSDGGEESAGHTKRKPSRLNEATRNEPALRCNYEVYPSLKAHGRNAHPPRRQRFL